MIIDALLVALASLIAGFASVLPTDTLTSFASGWDAACAGVSPYLSMMNVVWDMPMSFAVITGLFSFRFLMLHWEVVRWVLERVH